MKLVRCVFATCSIVFDADAAPRCKGHEKYEHGPDPNWRYGPSTAAVAILEWCLVCPNGHALHDLPGWRKLPRRAPTKEERDAGFDWILVGFDLTPGERKAGVRAARDEGAGA